jgi:hypothetical protein
LIDLVVNQAGNHSHLICVVGRSRSLHGKTEAGHWRRLLVQIINGDFNVLWIIDIQLLLAPSVLEIGALKNLWILNRHPTGTLDLSLQDK